MPYGFETSNGTVYPQIIIPGIGTPGIPGLGYYDPGSSLSPSIWGSNPNVSGGLPIDGLQGFDSAYKNFLSQVAGFESGLTSLTTGLTNLENGLGLGLGAVGAGVGIVEVAGPAVLLYFGYKYAKKHGMV